MWLPKTDNPYCDVSTYTLRDIPEQAMSMLDSNGKPLIVVNGRTLVDEPAYGRFLLAHECCHHTLGHVGRYKENLGHVGPQPFFYIAPELKQMELEADCCAVRMLRFKHETDSIESAEAAMIDFGETPTGAIIRPETSGRTTSPNARRKTDIRAALRFLHDAVRHSVS